MNSPNEFTNFERPHHVAIWYYEELFSPSPLLTNEDLWRALNLIEIVNIQGYKVQTL